MKTATLIAAMTLTCCLPLAAQQSVEQKPSAAETDLKTQMQLYEVALRAQINGAGKRLADWAQTVSPGAILVATGETSITSVPLPSGSLVFEMQLPQILGWEVLRYYQQLPPEPRPDPRVTVPAPPRQGGAAKPNDPNLVRVAAKCDGSDPASVDSKQLYHECVRQAMIDAILNNSGILSVKEGQWLTIAVSNADDGFTNPLNPNRSKKLLVSIKGEDLQALRQLKITKDQARQRIEVKWF